MFTNHTNVHAHSQRGKTVLAAEVSASLQRQLDDNPAGVTRLKVTHITTVLSLFPPLSRSHTHARTDSRKEAN